MSLGLGRAEMHIAWQVGGVEMLSGAIMLLLGSGFLMLRLGAAVGSLPSPLKDGEGRRCGGGDVGCACWWLRGLFR